MGKFKTAMAVLFFAGATGILWADDLNPQPYPPKGGGSANNPTAVESTDGGNQMRKAGGSQMTANDQAQITGNLKGDGKNLSTGEHFPKFRTAKSKSSGKNSVYGKFRSKQNLSPAKIGSGTGGGGSGKVSLGNSTKSAAVDAFKKTQGFYKEQPGGNGGTNNLPAEQK